MIRLLASHDLGNLVTKTLIYLQGSSKPPAVYKSSPLGGTRTGHNAAAGTGSGSAQGLGPINENPNTMMQNSVTHGGDDPFGHGQRAQAEVSARH